MRFINFSLVSTSLLPHCIRAHIERKSNKVKSVVWDDEECFWHLCEDEEDASHDELEKIVISLFTNFRWNDKNSSQRWQSFESFRSELFHLIDWCLWENLLKGKVWLKLTRNWQSEVLTDFASYFRAMKFFFTEIRSKCKRRMLNFSRIRS